MSAGWWFVGSILVGGVGTAVLIAIGNSDGRSRFGRWWAGTPKVVNPVGWDEQAQRCHDVQPHPGNVLLHYSTCWCRTSPNPSYASAPVDKSATGNDHSLPGSA